ncbi:MAG: PAS domain S-box protein [Planctomycetes bacterium]|nr:PAS domain S-box protein [Planctomycetota bacterium]
MPLVATPRAQVSLPEPPAAEARMQALLEAIVDGVVSIDARGRILSFNPAAERMFGYRKEELLGQSVNILMPADYAAKHDSYIANYLNTGVKKIIGIGREVIGLRKDGSTFPMDLSVAEARVVGERIFVGVLRDISARKIAEQELERSHDILAKTVAELEAKNEEIRAMTQQLWQAAKLASVGELAASMAHELNNPLATVSLRIESVLSRTQADDPRRKQLTVIDQEIKRMGDLVGNLLQFARRGGDQISTVEIRDELACAVDLINHHLRKRMITIVQDLAPDTPAIYADRQKLRQVFLNVLTNAGDAMPRGGTLTLRTSPTTLDDGEPGIRIAFTDTGFGIPDELLPRIMEPFFTTKEEGKGTGLGLAICRRIVQEHRGTISIQSTPDHGTTVCIDLPVKNRGNVKPLNEVCCDSDDPG